MEEQPKHKVDLLLTILLVLVTALIFGAIGFAYGQQFTDESNAINDKSSENLVVVPAVSSTASVSASATADVTANWKTYTNSAYGFSFKYPTDWFIHEGDNGNILSVTNLSTGGIDKENTAATLEKEGKNAYEGIYFSNSEPSADNVIRTEDKTVADKTIKLSYYRNSETPGSSTVFAKRGLWTNSDGKKITVGTLTETGTESNEIAMLGQIISTFQFTK